MIKRIISIFLVFVVFLVGVICGFVIDRLLISKRMPFHRQPHQGQEIKIPHVLGNRFSKNLNLTDEQKNKLNQILEKNKDVMKNLRNEMEPKFNKVRASLETEIKSILNDEQRQQFEKIAEKARKKIIWNVGKGKKKK